MLSIVGQLSKMYVTRPMAVRSTATAPARTDCEPSAEFLPKKSGFRHQVPKPPGQFKTVYSMFMSQNLVLGVRTTIQLRRLGKLWKSLSEEEKQPYKDAFWQHRATIAARTMAFNESLTQEERFHRAMYTIRHDAIITQRRINALSKMLNEPNAQIVNSFKYFLDEHYNVDGRRRTDEEYEEKLGTESRGRNLSGSSKMVARCQELAQKWRSLSKEEKKNYREKQNIQLTRKMQEISEWRENSPRDYLEEVNMLRALLRSRKTFINEPEKIWRLINDFERPPPVEDKKI